MVGLTLLVKALLFAWGLVMVALVNDQPVDFGQVKSLAWPWDGIGGVFGWLENDEPENVVMYGVTELAAIGLGLAGTVVAAFRFRPGWFTWMTGNWLLFVSTSFVLSVPRYALTMFPLFAWFAQLAERRWLGIVLGGVSMVLLLWFSARFATGAWAF